MIGQHFQRDETRMQFEFRCFFLEVVSGFRKVLELTEVFRVKKSF